MSMVRTRPTWARRSRTRSAGPTVLEPAPAAALARQLAPLPAGADRRTPSGGALAADIDADRRCSASATLAGLDPRDRGGRAPARDRLRVPIGVGADGRPIELDIKESAQGGMGPHGLVIGATGSGKSELLRTLVLGAGDHPLAPRT